MIVQKDRECPYCNMAKTLLTSEKQEFEVVEMTKDELIKGGFTSVPKIFDDDEYVGGYNEFVPYLYRKLHP
jgi:glutaredoxin